MSRFFRMAGIAAIALCAVTLYGSLQQSGQRVMTDPSALLDALAPLMADSGLHRRSDVLIEMNGREVALGFSRRGCEGMILVAVLPRTAQGWAHLAPRLDLSSFDIGYLYEGRLYRAVPRFERLAGGLLGEMRPHDASQPPPVVAIAEYGQCDLAIAAAPALEGASWGRLSTAGLSGSSRVVGEGST